MRVNLLFNENIKANKFSWQSGSVINNKKLFSETDIIRDLKLDIILDAMSDGDEALKKICKNILLRPLVQIEDIHIRQEVIQDALKIPDFFLSVYGVLNDCINQPDTYKELSHPENSKFITSMKKVIEYSEIADYYSTQLEAIHDLITADISKFRSKRLIDLCSEFISEYTNDFLNEIRQTLKQLLRLKAGTDIIIDGHIGTGLKLTDIKLINIFGENKQFNNSGEQKNLLHTINKKLNVIKGKQSTAVIQLDNNILIGQGEEIIEAALIWIVKLLSNYTNECRNHFNMLHEMFGFYTGAIKLYMKLNTAGIKTAFPRLIENDGTNYEFTELTDIGLALKNNKPVVGNTMRINSKKLCIITGANQGGKTTFLRSIGLAQLLAQAGLFVTAEDFSCCIYSGIFTHFPNEEDEELRYGLLERELSKLNELVSHMQPGALLLMNETFSTTIEYDASILAEQIITAFTGCGITTFFVTHLYEYAHKLFIGNIPGCGFYRAGRNPDGSRSYKVDEGEPQKSSYALDLYHQIFV
jgi:DNA mismatch repair ATPase MutS